MEVQLRAPKHRFHPLMRNRGMGYTQPPDCTPTIPGAIPNPGCIAEQARIQQENMAEHDEGQRQTFIDNCNRDWELNDQQYAALGLPRPANQCEAMYPASGRGAVAPVQIQPVYMAPTPVSSLVPAPTSSTAVMAHPAPSGGMVASAPAPVPTPSGNGGTQSANIPQPDAVDKISMLLGSDISEGSGIPVWGVVLAVGAVLYFMTKGK